jgi:uncharacterized peroxidase-related enzyme
MSRIPAVDPDTATGETAELFDAAKKKMGGVPNVLRVLGNSPAALKAYLTLSDVLAGTSFDAREREAIALAVAGANRCGYCAAAHSFISKNLKVSDDEIQRRLRGETDDARLQAALTFARTLVEKKGWADDQDLAAAREAGLGDREIVEIVALTVANILTNYTNHVADTDVDFPEVKV